MLKSVGIMLAIAAFYEIWQMDVKTAFLNGFLKEELFRYIKTKHPPIPLRPSAFLIVRSQLLVVSGRRIRCFIPCFLLSGLGSYSGGNF